MYMIEHKNADGLSMRYIQGEILLNVLSSMVTFHLFCVLHHAIYLIPVLLEKTTALTMIVTMFYLHLRTFKMGQNIIKRYKYFLLYIVS